MTKTIIDPAYDFLKEYIEDLPHRFASLDKVLHAQRNLIKEDTVQGTRLIIKSFRRIYLTNRIRYTYFYASKAQRAFDNGKLLLEKDFLTPCPIAYIETSRHGLIDQMFFVSEYTDFQPLNTVNKTLDSATLQLLKSLAHHTFRLHQSNIYHVDYSTGNILFRERNGEYEFSLIDNNRMKLGVISFKKGIRNFSRLGLPAEHLALVGKEYARLWGVDEVAALERLFHHKMAHHRKGAVKKLLKRTVAALRDRSI